MTVRDGLRPSVAPGTRIAQTRFFSLVAASLFLAIGYLAAGITTGVVDLGLFEPSAEMKRSVTIRELNRELPRDLGNGTRIDEVWADAEGIYYRFTLTEVASDEVHAFDLSELSFESARPRICSRPQIWRLRDTDLAFIESQYMSSDGYVLMTVRIHKSDCE